MKYASVAVNPLLDTALRSLRVLDGVDIEMIELMSGPVILDTRACPGVNRASRTLGEIRNIKAGGTDPGADFYDTMKGPGAASAPASGASSEFASIFNEPLLKGSSIDSSVAGNGIDPWPRPPATNLGDAQRYEVIGHHLGRAETPPPRDGRVVELAVNCRARAAATPAASAKEFCQLATECNAQLDRNDRLLALDNQSEDVADLSGDIVDAIDATNCVIESFESGPAKSKRLAEEAELVLLELSAIQIRVARLKRATEARLKTARSAG